MARRVSWTNNSSGHSGTYVYRAPTLDPQDLPAPVATVDPVAQGVRAEWPDRDGEGDLCYMVRDFDAQGVGEVSEGYCFEAAPSIESAQIGDYIEGGVYAGKITYEDGREYHLVASEADGETYGDQWGNYQVSTGANDTDDGKVNQNLILTSFDNGDSYAFYHARDYTGGGYSDWYVPAVNELALLYANLAGHSEFADNVASGNYTWTSTESWSNVAFDQRFSDGDADGAIKSTTTRRTRPVRRIAV